jgi:hypothetical protein
MLGTTDMGSMEATRTPEEVAVDIIDFLESEMETGKFCHKGQVRNW